MYVFCHQSPSLAVRKNETSGLHLATISIKKERRGREKKKKSRRDAFGGGTLTARAET